MDIRLKPEYTVVFIQSPLLFTISFFFALFVFMTLVLYFTNKKLYLEELVAEVYIKKYEIPKFSFFHYGIIHCVTSRGKAIKLIDPGYVFRNHVSKITPREISEIKFCIEFKWRIILLMNINVMEMTTKSFNLKTVRQL